MAEADAEDRQRVDQRAHRLADRPARPPDRPGRSTGRAPRGSQREHLLGLVARRHHGHVEALLDQQAQDVALDAEVDTRRRGSARRRARRARHLAGDAAPAALAPRVARVAADLAPRDRGRRGRRSPRAIATSAATSCCAGSVESTPTCAPPSRIRRTSARVSMPAMPGHAVARAGTSSSDPARAPVRRLRNSSFTTKPDRKGRRDSSSSRFTPTLPICG